MRRGVALLGTGLLVVALGLCWGCSEEVDLRSRHSEPVAEEQPAREEQPVQETPADEPAGHETKYISDPDVFQELVLEADTPVLVDFYANWCGPCKTLSPTIQKIRGDYAGRAAVYKVNVDKAGALARQYGARSIPLVVMFQDGRIVEKWVGLRPESTYTQALDKALQ